MNEVKKETGRSSDWFEELLYSRQKSSGSGIGNCSSSGKYTQGEDDYWADRYLREVNKGFTLFDTGRQKKEKRPGGDRDASQETKLTIA